MENEVEGHHNLLWKTPFVEMPINHRITNVWRTKPLPSTHVIRKFQKTHELAAHSWCGNRLDHCRAPRTLNNIAKSHASLRASFACQSTTVNLHKCPHHCHHYARGPRASQPTCERSTGSCVGSARAACCMHQNILRPPCNLSASLGLCLSRSHTLFGFVCLSTLLSAKSEHTVTVNCEVLQMTHQLARAAGSSAVAMSTGVLDHLTKR